MVPSCVDFGTKIFVVAKCIGGFRLAPPQTKYYSENGVLTCFQSILDLLNHAESRGDVFISMFVDLCG